MGLLELIRTCADLLEFIRPSMIVKVEAAVPLSPYFEGGLCFFWKSEIFKKLIVQKDQDFTPIKISQNVSTLLQNHFWFTMLYLCFKLFKKWLSENAKIPRPPTLVRKYRNLFKIMFDLIGFTHVLRCFMIFIFPKYIKSPPPKNLWKRLEIPIVLTHHISKNKKH